MPGLSTCQGQPRERHEEPDHGILRAASVRPTGTIHRVAAPHDIRRRVCLLIEDVAAETVDRLRAVGVIVERAGPSAQQSMTAMSSRFFSYLDYLVRHGDGYANVMLADPATSIFQADPFAAPLPADIVYTGEHRRIGETPAVHDAVVLAYGEAVAHNIRDCAVSNSSATLGSLSGMLRYLTAMTHQLGGRTTPITGAIDQGVHNYVVHMHPLAGAWLDPTDRNVMALDTLPEDAVEIVEQGALIGGRSVPVLSRWDASAKLTQHVRTSPRFRLDEHVRAAGSPAGVSHARCGGRLLPASARRGLAGAVPRQPALRQRCRSMFTASAISIRANSRS